MYALFFIILSKLQEKRPQGCGVTMFGKRNTGVIFRVTSLSWMYTFPNLIKNSTEHLPIL